MAHSLCFHDVSSMLSAISDGHLTVWYYPRSVTEVTLPRQFRTCSVLLMPLFFLQCSSVYIDKDVLSRARFQRAAEYVHCIYVSPIRSATTSHFSRDLDVCLTSASYVLSHYSDFGKNPRIVSFLDSQCVVRRGDGSYLHIKYVLCVDHTFPLLPDLPRHMPCFNLTLTPTSLLLSCEPVTV